MSVKNCEDISLDNAQQLLVWIIKLGQAITKEFNQLLTPLGLTFNQVSILFILAEAEKEHAHLSMHELSKLLDVSMANTSGLIDRLERDGYVQRKRSNTDRRAYILLLTKKGENMVCQLESAWPPPEMKEIDQLFKKTSASEREVLKKIFIGITNTLEKI